MTRRKHRSVLFFLGAWLALALLSFQGFAQVYVGGVISSSTTWSKQNNPYIVVENVTVPPGITLTIEPGVRMLFKVNTNITVKGDLVARGTPSDSIYFLPDDENWFGIIFHAAQTQFDAEGNYLSGNILSYARVEHTSYSVTLQYNSGVRIENSYLGRSAYGVYITESNYSVVRNCTIKAADFGVFFSSLSSSNYNRFPGNAIIDCKYVGFFINNSSGIITHNEISNCYIARNLIGLYMGNDGPVDVGNTVIKGNVIANNEFGIKCYQDSSLISMNRISNNHTGIELFGARASVISNNIISGNPSWGIRLTSGASDNLIEGNNVFNNSKGIFITAGSGSHSDNNRVIGNAIHRNSDSLMHIECGPQGAIQYNNFYDNGDTNTFSNLTALEIDARYNWWGTADTALINTLIYDAWDDPGLGLVRYRDFEAAPLPEAPISAPMHVLKRDIGNNVLLSWSPNPESDLEGYRIHYGKFDGMQFETRIEAGTDTVFLLQGVSVFDSVAVTAYDADADGQYDFPEGHESEFSLAVLAPYAGPDTATCMGYPVTLNRSSAYDYMTLSWVTSGDGSFDDRTVLHPVYTPGPADLMAGSCLITLKVRGENWALSDQFVLSMDKEPVVFAGNDTAIDLHLSLELDRGMALHYRHLQWITTGDGSFSDPLHVNAVYTPGEADIANGSVQLVLSAASACGVATDTLILSLYPVYSISGKVHAGDLPAVNSRILLMGSEGGRLKGLQSLETADDGGFAFSSMPGGEYLIYAQPDQSQFREYLPTYYYNEISWESAYRIALDADAYDVDISLVRIPYKLPSGTGKLEGYCFSGDSPDKLCENVPVLIYDKSMKYLLGWTMVSDGTFSLSGLPFGDYVLVAEKAGYTSTPSGVLSVTPAVPEIRDIVVSIVPFKALVYRSGQDERHEEEIFIIPNPVHDRLLLTGIGSRELREAFLVSASGSRLNLMPLLAGDHSGNITCDPGSIAPGIYLLQLVFADGTVFTDKLVKY